MDEAIPGARAPAPALMILRAVPRGKRRPAASAQPHPVGSPVATVGGTVLTTMRQPMAQRCMHDPIPRLSPGLCPSRPGAIDPQNTRGSDDDSTEVDWSEVAPGGPTHRRVLGRCLWSEGGHSNFLAAVTAPRSRLNSCHSRPVNVYFNLKDLYELEGTPFPQDVKFDELRRRRAEGDHLEARQRHRPAGPFLAAHEACDGRKEFAKFAKFAQIGSSSPFCEYCELISLMVVRGRT
jgi:hypothetical protein